LTLGTHAAPGSWIDVTDIQRLRPEILTGPKNPNPEAFLEDENVTYGDAVRAFRKKLILDRLRRHANNVSAASTSLGISEPTFYRYWTDAADPLARNALQPRAALPTHSMRNDSVRALPG
jgi:DNA-binding NtrC family response regulator